MLEVKDLRVSYGQSEVIHGIDFVTAKDETLAIMGRNGMGKTTLFKSLIGILPGSSGSIVLDGREVGNLPSHERVAAGLAYVPQGRMIFPNLTVMENIESGLETLKTSKVPDEIFDLFPVLREMRKRKGGNLSGGQQQQLAIARALVSEPKVLLLDEPTEGIQPSIIKDIAHTLNEIRRMKKIAIVVSEQVLSFTMAIADRLAVIEKGKIIHEEEGKSANQEKIASYLAV
ncbi:urea ABC transporter ATP-binding subunit UrtE [Billgrantia endophytica]|uniref:Urea ABC transporter ATP-binding subunit UrtE n=1 Tax=Billgrantia endophytica TaxID=2033802 RepID=A0A2N7U5P6_9GAMM|nr:urea ABC transporter ATP-binding subunit UrtE [Halomonas endophytica]PMR75758.1 urea ABC transporter ATP-binding subunit UrtE [Halomonas endophytica]